MENKYNLSDTGMFVGARLCWKAPGIWVELTQDGVKNIVDVRIDERSDDNGES